MAVFIPQTSTMVSVYNTEMIWSSVQGFHKWRRWCQLGQLKCQMNMCMMNKLMLGPGARVLMCTSAEISHVCLWVLSKHRLNAVKTVRCYVFVLFFSMQVHFILTFSVCTSQLSKNTMDESNYSNRVKWSNEEVWKCLDIYEKCSIEASWEEPIVAELKYVIHFYNLAVA